MSNVYIAVAHGNFGQALLLDVLAGSCKLSNLADIGRLRSLTAGVGVNLGIENEDVHVVTGSNHVVKATVTNVVGPAVATEDPEGFLRQEFLVLDDCQGIRATLFGRWGQSIKVVLCRSFTFLGAILRFKPHLSCSFRLGIMLVALQNVLRVGDKLFTHGVVAKHHAHAEFRVVLEQRIAPCRTMTLLVHRVRRRCGGVTPNGRAARGVCDVHAVAEQLGDQARIRRFSATSAAARELKQRLLELRALLRSIRDLGFFCNVRHAVIEYFLLILLRISGNHSQRLGGALPNAHAAAHAVKRRHCHGVQVLALALAGLERHQARLFRCGSSFFARKRKRTQRCMRAHERAAVALGALFGMPFRNAHSHATLLVGCCAQLELAIGAIGEGRHRQTVAIHARNGQHDVGDHLHQRGIACKRVLLRLVLRIGPRCRHINLHERRSARIDCLMVAINNVLTLLDVRLRCRIFHVSNSHFLR